MPDPVTQSETEDMLSSVRRLLAQDESGAARPPMGQGAQPGSRRLYLEETYRQDFTGGPGRAANSVGPVMRPLAAASPEQGPVAGDSRPDRAEAPRPAAADRLVLTPAQRVDAAEAKPEQPQRAAAEALGEAVAAEIRSRLASTIAELEAAVTEGDDEWEPDGSEAAPVMDWQHEEPSFIGRHARRDTQSQPAGPAAPVAAAEVPALASDQSPATAPLSLIDEDLMRRIVADVVREELRGALGERITRNVRKLVRREVYRVLSAQDFD
ncbi:hypothetical protein [Pseudoroseicyclus aestuarii]|uniref:Cell pole-organizing protein PopZ n=1 Tax=Pseudoroseicyclus aestuarii TaxID=1795041 RepID=A0A318SQV1_9RHOB|nr:hypothetical protein [Pseudoroseicyclus aestuarii]PYE84033.1 hypothetical protein DFP88_103397 [Pseudoroseicyclus aestuarii]